jgi:hypothetical protein
MTIYSFLEECKGLWPQSELTNKQREFYEIKLSQFSDKEVSSLFAWLTDHCKYFPKIADIYEAARHCGFTDRVKPYAPHKWEAAECRLCGGSGQLAVFYEQSFDPENGFRLLTLKRVMQFQASQGVIKTTDWTRYYFRCQCELGDASTLEKGLPRWDSQKPSALKLAL